MTQLTVVTTGEETTALARLDQALVSKFGIDRARIDEIKLECEGLSFDTPKEYTESNKKLALARETRVAIEKRRKELKEPTIQEGKRIDECAAILTAEIEPIERSLKAKKDAVDAEKELVRKEKEAAERARLEEQARLANEAREAELRAIREAEEKRLAEERAAIEAEKARLAAEQKTRDEAARIERERVEAEQAIERARLQADREAFEAEQRKAAEARRAEEVRIENERRKIEQAERDRLAKIQAEKDAAEKLERERVEAEEKRVAELERQAAIAERIAALRPDKEKVENVAEYVTQCLGAAIKNNEVTSDEARKALSAFTVSVAEACKTLRGFGEK
jgi:hypothetical protein